MNGDDWTYTAPEPEMYGPRTLLRSILDAAVLDAWRNPPPVEYRAAIIEPDVPECLALTLEPWTVKYDAEPLEEL